MRINLNAAEVFVSTGGRDFDPKGRVNLFIHGSGQSHLSWLLQGRFLANRTDLQVLNADMPGHGQSGGTPLATIEEQADWNAALLAELGVEKAYVCGHSQGGLVALEMVKRHPALADKLILIATAMAIPVNDWLVDNAAKAQHKAIAAMMAWGFGTPGDFHDHTMPGISHVNYGSSLMSVNQPGALHADLKACQAYSGGPDAAASVSIPTLCVLAQKDKMTPAKAGRQMFASIEGAQLVEIPGAGHMLPCEKPDEVNAAIRGFLG